MTSDPQELPIPEEDTVESSGPIVSDLSARSDVGIEQGHHFAGPEGEEGEDFLLPIPDAVISDEDEELLRAVLGGNDSVVEERGITRVPPGGRIGNVRLEGILLRAAEGTVYRGRNERDGKEVAVRALRWSKGIDAKVLAERSNRLKRLSHPALIRVIEFHEQHGGRYVVTELSRGERLRSALQSLPDVDLRRAWCASLADGVATLHRASLVHGHIDSSRVWVDNNNVRLSGIEFAALGDFADESRARDAQRLGRVIVEIATGRDCSSIQRLSSHERDAVDAVTPGLYTLLKRAYSGDWDAIASIARVLSDRNRRQILLEVGLGIAIAVIVYVARVLIGH